MPLQQKPGVGSGLPNVTDEGAQRTGGQVPGPEEAKRAPETGHGGSEARTGLQGAQLLPQPTQVPRLLQLLRKHFTFIHEPALWVCFYTILRTFSNIASTKSGF